MRLIITILGVFFTGQSTGQVSHRETDTGHINFLLVQSALIQKTSPDKSYELASVALSKAEQIGYQPGLANANSLLGNASAYKKDYTAAINYLEKAKALYQNEEDDFHLAQVLKKMGDIYSLRSYFRQSSDSYREALPLLRKTNQAVLYSECVEGMGNIASAFGRYRNAAGFFLRSLALKKSLGDEKGEVTVTVKIYSAYLNARAYDSALYFISQLQNLKATDAYLKTIALADECIACCLSGRLPEAAVALEKADALLPASNNRDEMIRICMARTVYAMATGDRELAKKYFDSTGALLTGSRNPELADAGFNYLAEISKMKGDYKTAYEMLKQAEKYKDLYRTENMDRKKAEVENASELSMKDNEIEYLNLVNKLKAAQLSKEELKRLALLRENILKDSSLADQQRLMAALETESVLRTKQLEKEKELGRSLSRENSLKEKMLKNETRNKKMLWVGIGLMSLLGGIIFYQYNRQKSKNNIIRKQAAELGILNKEIHHRVKNNLQVISSMLDLQSQSIQDERAAAILKEGMQRVQSMAFIHQNLYQGSAANGVDMKEYIRVLSTHLFQTYNIRTDKISFLSDIENLSLHTDTAIPLGMMINELISNSLKYAFKKKQTGNIQVSMRKAGHELLLRVKDDGDGLPRDFDPGKISSFGYEIIKAFCQKLKARLSVDGINGTDVQIIVSKFTTID
jgi:two-component sensor histidine kinase